MPILYDSHVHTPYCKHAQDSMADYADQSIACGLAGLIFTDHNPMPLPYSQSERMDIDQLDHYINDVLHVQECYRGRLDVRLGLECDYLESFPDMHPWLNSQIDHTEWDYILGSVHATLTPYGDAHFNADILRFQRDYFTHLADAAETGLFDALAHPDLVKIKFPQEWRLDDVLDAVRPALDRIARTGIALELNTSGLHKPVPEFMPEMRFLTEMRQRNIPVVLGSDAHVPNRIAADFATALELLQTIGYSHTTVLVNRHPRQIPISESLQSLTT